MLIFEIFPKHGEHVMAQKKPLIVDGEFMEVKLDAKISDVVDPDVGSVITHDGMLIPRSEFTRVAVRNGRCGVSAGGSVLVRPDNPGGNPGSAMAPGAKGECHFHHGTPPCLVWG